MNGAGALAQGGRIGFKVLLAAIGLGIGAIAGLVIGIFSGLIPILC